ncbi:hypothetical protein [Sulfuriferula sp. AH1]|uniref:hypothetical protein n=1 Tax=Sulfuriferula sp. AH1 TaxID=1985873 RepID=UPI0012FC0A66|nr:hypothetical protein [Sulfuriferula sp. AH1]
MNMNEIPQRKNKIANQHAIHEIKGTGDYHSKGQLIRIMQLQYGDEPCFATDKRYTCTELCEWGRECRKLVAQWRR